jgi:hypothetical protein
MSWQLASSSKIKVIVLVSHINEESEIDFSEVDGALF